jgi:hypothetical protein
VPTLRRQERSTRLTAWSCQSLRRRPSGSQYADRATHRSASRGGAPIGQADPVARTSKTSPSRSCARHVSSPGRWCFAPEALSVKISSFRKTVDLLGLAAGPECPTFGSRASFRQMGCLCGTRNRSRQWIEFLITAAQVIKGSLVGIPRNWGRSHEFLG